MQNQTTIILINYKNWEDTIECLSSLEKLDYSIFNIIVVEVCNLNNSVNHLDEFIDKTCLKIVLLQTTENKGFAYANNLAINYALKNLENSFFWILNNDTIVLYNTLDELIKFYHRKITDIKVGFVGSKIMDYHNPKMVQNTGGTFSSCTGISTLLFFNTLEQNIIFPQEIKPDYVTGASMFFHKSILNEIGLMPENYFLYYEDIDWCISAQKRGFSNFISMESIVFHKQGGSTGNKYDKKTSNSQFRKHMYSSYKIFFRRHYRHKLFLCNLLLFKQFVGRIARFNFKEAKIIFEVLIS